MSERYDSMYEDVDLEAGIVSDVDMDKKSSMCYKCCKTSTYFVKPFVVSFGAVAGSCLGIFFVGMITPLTLNIAIHTLLPPPYK